jgi:hypothetical protein
MINPRTKIFFMVVPREFLIAAVRTLFGPGLYPIPEILPSSGIRGTRMGGVKS